MSDEAAAAAGQQRPCASTTAAKLTDAQGYMRTFGVSRYVFRMMALRADPGVTKASW